MLLNRLTGAAPRAARHVDAGGAQEHPVGIEQRVSVDIRLHAQVERSAVLGGLRRIAGGLRRIAGGMSRGGAGEGHDSHEPDQHARRGEPGDPSRHPVSLCPARGRPAPLYPETFCSRYRYTGVGEYDCQRLGHLTIHDTGTESEREMLSAEPVPFAMPERDVRRKRPPALSFLLRLETLRGARPGSRRCWCWTSSASPGRCSRR